MIKPCAPAGTGRARAFGCNGQPKPVGRLHGRQRLRHQAVRFLPAHRNPAKVEQPTPHQWPPKQRMFGPKMHRPAQRPFGQQTDKKISRRSVRIHHNDAFGPRQFGLQQRPPHAAQQPRGQATAAHGWRQRLAPVARQPMSRRYCEPGSSIPCMASSARRRASPALAPKAVTHSTRPPAPTKQPLASRAVPA